MKYFDSKTPTIVSHVSSQRLASFLNTLILYILKMGNINSPTGWLQKCEKKNPKKIPVFILSVLDFCRNVMMHHGGCERESTLSMHENSFFYMKTTIISVIICCSNHFN